MLEHKTLFHLNMFLCRSHDFCEQIPGVLQYKYEENSELLVQQSIQTSTPEVGPGTRGTSSTRGTRGSG